MVRQLELDFVSASTVTQFITEAGVYEAQGKRPTMEDATVAQESVTVPGLNHPISMYCVFDGHGGTSCSEYANQHYVDELILALAGQTDADGTSVPQKMCEVLYKLDETYQVHPEHSGVSDGTGSCAVCVVFYDGDK